MADKISAATALTNAKTLLPVPFTGSNGTEEYMNFERAAYAALHNKNPSINDLIDKYPSSTEIPKNESSNKEEMDNDQTLSIFCIQSVTSGPAYALLKQVTIRKGMPGYLPYPGLRQWHLLKEEYAASNASTNASLLKQFMELSYTTATDMQANILDIRNSLRMGSGYHLDDFMIRGKILLELEKQNKYEHIRSTYANLPSDSRDKTWKTLLEECKTLERSSIHPSSNDSPSALWSAGKNKPHNKPKLQSNNSNQKSNKSFPATSKPSQERNPCTTCNSIKHSTEDHIDQKVWNKVYKAVQNKLNEQAVANLAVTSSTNNDNEPAYSFVLEQQTSVSLSTTSGEVESKIMYDTCANRHLFNPNTSGMLFENIKNIRTADPVTTANGQSFSPTSTGDVTFRVDTTDLKGVSKSTIKISLKDVLLDTSLKFNIISASKFIRKSINNEFYQGSKWSIGDSILLDNRKYRIPVYNTNDLTYFLYVPIVNNVVVNLNVTKTKPRQTLTKEQCIKLHNEQGHLNYNDLRIINPNVIIPTEMNDDECRVCALTKGKKHNVSKTSDVKVTKPGDLYYLDLSGRSAIPSLSGCHYVLGFIEAYSGKPITFPIISTNDTSKQILKAKIMMNNIGVKMGLGTTFRCDQDVGAFKSQEFVDMCHKLLIHVTYTPPFTHQYNGRIERFWYTCFNMATSMFLGSPNPIPIKLWTTAVMYATWVRGYCPTTITKQVPNTMLKIKENKPFHIYGATVADLINGHHKKMTERSRLGIFLGWSTVSNCALIYHPDTGRVTESINFTVLHNEKVMKHEGPKQKATDIQDLFLTCAYLTELKLETVQLNLNTKITNIDDIQFTEQAIPFENQQVPIATDQDIPSQIQSTPSVPNIIPPAIPNVIRESNRLRSTAWKPASKNYHQSINLITEAQSSQNIITDRGDIVTESHIKNTTPISLLTKVPTSIHKALNQESILEVNKWEQARQKEHSSIKEKEVYDEVLLSDVTPGTPILFSHEICNIKMNGTYKVRLVVNGNEHEADKSETFAPVPGLDSIRALLSNACEKDYYIEVMDVDTAFLYAPLKDYVLVHPPKGMQYNANNQRIVYKLKKALYGLPEAGHCWNKTITDTLTDKEINGGLEMVQSHTEPCLFTSNTNTSDICLSMVWVDDIIMAAKDQNIIDKKKALLAAKFGMKFLGPIKSIVGIEVNYDKQKGIMELSQRQYIAMLLEKYGMSDCAPAIHPAADGMLPLLPADENSIMASPSDTKLYVEIVGSIGWLSLCTGVSLPYYVSQAQKYVSKVTDKHVMFIKHLLRFIKKIRDNTITYRRYPTKDQNFVPGELITFTDADWAGDKEKMRSQSGMALLLNGAVIAYGSQVQKCVATSTMEAELIATSKSAKSLIYHDRLQNDMGNVQTKPLKFKEDNQSVILALKNKIASKQTRHIDIKYFFLREHIESKLIQMIHVKTTDNLADIYTKNVPRVQFNLILKQLTGDY